MTLCGVQIGVGEECEALRELSRCRSSDKVIKKVFSTQWAHFSGATGWDFTDKAVAEFMIMWNRCVLEISQV